jgi:hypothetical protein
MAEKMMAAVAEIATQPRKRHPSGIRLPSPQDLPNTFLFRHALCAYLLHVRWIKNGGQKNVKPEKIRNDLVDVIFCSYATFFDGMLTHDKKLASLHDESRAVLGLIGII